MAAATTVGRRFTQLIQHLGISKNAFALSLDKTATVIQHLVDERNKPGYDLLCKVFAVYPQVSKDWLLLGQGPMLMPVAAAAPTAPPPGAAAATTTEARAAATEAQPQPAAPLASRQTELSLPAAPPETPALTAEKPVEKSADKEAAVPFAAAASPAAPVTVALAPSGALSGSGPTHTSAGNIEAVLTAALHAQHLQHQLALAEQRNQHLLEQQRLMQQLLDLAQRR